jgi:MFS family permease
MTTPDDTANSPNAPGPRFAWEIVALLWVAQFLNQADRQVFNVTLPLIQQDFGLTSQQMGLVATTFTVVFGLLVPFAGIAGDRFARRNIVVVSLIVFSTGTLLTGAASGFLLLLLFRGVATGAGEALYAPAAAAWIGEAHVKTRARALSVHQTANYTGVVFGSLLAGWMADRFGWRSAFIALGVAGLVWAVALVFRTRHQPRIRPAANAPLLMGEAARTIAGSPGLIAQLVGFSGLVFILSGYLTWMPTLLYEKFDLSLADAGFSSVAYHHLLGYVGLLVTGFTTDRLISRYPRIRLFAMAGGLIMCAPFIWMSAAANELWLVLAALSGFGFFRGVYDANLFAAIFDIVDDRLRSSVTGLIVASAYVFGALAPLIMGTLKDEYGLTTGLDILAAVALATGVTFLLLVVAAKPRIGFGT